MPPNDLAPTRHGFTQRIAVSLAEAAFPSGDRLTAPDPARVVDTVESWLRASPALRRGVRGLLWWLEFDHLSRHGTRFSAAGIAARRAFLRRHARNTLRGALLRAVSAPFRAAYLLDDENFRRIGAATSLPAPAAAPEAQWRRQVVTPDQAATSGDIECDVVVVGTGAGGAAAAYELSGRGLAVVVIEEGRLHERHEFSGRLAEMIPRLYRSPGAIPALGNNVVPIPVGRAVGGTTTVNSGTCLRPAESTLADWLSEGLTQLSAQALLPYFEEVEKVLKVQPADPRFVGEIGRVIRSGAYRIGLREMGPLLRNAEGCDGRGRCQFGCPTDAKQSTLVSFIPRALERGTFLVTGTRADALLRAGNRVQGVVARGFRESGEPVTITVRARATVIAMGSLLTPPFLAANGVRNRWLGRNLSIHPVGAVSAWFPYREFGNGVTIPQGFGIHDLQEEGLRFEGCTYPLVAHGLSTDAQAEDFVRFIERYQQTGYFGFMIKDTSRGRVRRGVSRDVPLVLYRMNGADFALYRRGLDTVARIFLAAGAREVAIPGLMRAVVVRNEDELAAFWARRPRPRDFFVTGHHPLGTARIARDAGHGVCDPSHRVFGSDGLYVMDGSCVPTSLGVNPQVTIMALALRAARLLAERLSA